MYNLLLKYVYDVVDLLPRIALPCRDTRALFVVAVRLRTLRAVFAVVARDAFVVARATTPRDVLADAAAVFVRPVFARDATARAAFAFAVVAALVVVRRETVLDETRREFVAFARGDVLVVTVLATGAIGSANTARIDTNVEQTKNAPANRNTVPMAFLQKSAMLRLVIKFSRFLGIFPRKPVV